MHQEFEPPAPLRDAIKCFWYTDRPFTGPDFEVVPDGYAEIVFYFGSGCSLAGQPLPSPFLMGLLNQPVVLTTQGRLEVIGVRCYPWTVFDVLGLPPGKDGPRIFAHPVAQLQEPLQECVTDGRIADAVALVSRYFLEARPRAVDSTLFKAGAAMLEASGAMPVSQVAAAAHATVRTLERKFKQSSGYTVKDLSGLMRFEQARNRLWHEPEVSLAALAQELGYTDQSHLNREFKRYSGMTPAAFAQKRRR
ncbi:helix-turn-helix domain-containing protein [Pseudoduganella sp. FT26W]|uniref:Helix-turn-helix domain-containing protein n=1 Tax=Duganella aquatilis TaxID=2666082 RepID=A0A844CTA6_9BURK|nr:helix-turn-helix domain-containing protein [Duganella aquatilis]MRW83158.1 helix-turn-helix domain-containing protein [Duganella aquatilis]